MDECLRVATPSRGIANVQEVCTSRKSIVATAQDSLSGQGKLLVVPVVLARHGAAGQLNFVTLFVTYEVQQRSTR